VVEVLHAHNKLVCVWIDCSVTKETIEVYKRLIVLGVDCFCSDFPLQVTEIRDQIMSKLNVEIDRLEVPKGKIDFSALSAMDSCQSKTSTNEDSERDRSFSN